MISHTIQVCEQGHKNVFEILHFKILKLVRAIIESENVNEVWELTGSTKRFCDLADNSFYLLLEILLRVQSILSLTIGEVYEVASLVKQVMNASFGEEFKPNPDPSPMIV